MIDFQPQLCSVSGMTFFAQADPVATGKMLIDWQTILLAIIALMGTLGGPWIAYLVLKVKANSEKTATALAKVDEKTDKQGEMLKEVKLDVNSGRTKLEEKLTKVEEKLLVATGEKAASEERVRSEQDKAVALAATDSPAASPSTGSKRMGKAITELADAAEETKEQSEATTESAEKTEELARKTKL